VPAPERGCPIETPQWQLPRRREDRERDRQVEARSLLAQLRRSEVHRDPAERPLELGAVDPGADALLRLLAGAVGKPDDRESRHAALEVRLDLDAPWLEAYEGIADGASEHTATLATALRRNCTGMVTNPS